MTMRLMKKSEISSAQAVDKAREIQEGVKLSGRVDALRKLQADEEQTLEKFRRESLALIGTEISNLEGKRDELKIELVYLHEELNKESTLSREERKHLESLKAKLEEKERFLDEKAESLSLEEIDIAEALKSARDSTLRAETHEAQVKNLHESASVEKFEAQSILQNARKIEETVTRQKQEAESYFEMRESTLSAKEKEIIENQAENTRVAKALAKERLQLADQRATLERAMERLKQLR